MSKINIAIDGPVASGKGTITKLIARELGYRFLDTGAMYRAVAYYMSSKDITHENFKKDDLEGLRISFNEKSLVEVNGICVESFIRTSEISDLSSVFSKNLEIREFLTRIQKEIVKERGYVLEGRDATTIVAPDAELKIYLTASLEERARRRKEDYDKRGVHKDIKIITEEIKLRDDRDFNKGKYSLRIVDDAILIDNTNMSVDEQVSKIVHLAKEKKGEFEK